MYIYIYTPETPNQVRHPILGSVQKLVETTLYRFEEKHGGYLVRAALCFFLSTESGLAEGEVRHLLSLDDDVLADCYEWSYPPHTNES